MNLVHVAMPNRCWQRQFVNRNTIGRWINAETVCHTISFGYEMIIVNAWHSEPVPGKGRPSSRSSRVPLVRHLSFSVAADKYIYEYIYIYILLGSVPVSQWVPSYPASQVQAYWFTWSTHVAPFIQGSLAHSSVSGKLDLNMHCFSLALNANVLLGCNLSIN